MDNSYARFQFRSLKNRFIEALKYDYNNLKFPLVFLAKATIKLLLLFGKYDEAFKIIEVINRFGWKGSNTLAIRIVNTLIEKKPDVLSFIINKKIEMTLPLPHTQKFFDDPELLFKSIIIILKPNRGSEKGVVLIKYSYYFPLFHKFFNTSEFGEKYHIVLEPSWSGYCDATILSFLTLKASVFVMCPEKYDFDFIKGLRSNLIPVKIGANWWVDYRVFNKGDRAVNKQYDLIMIAGWAKYKRHGDFFRAIEKLRKRNIKLRVALVGYPLEIKLEDIEKLAIHFNIRDQIDFYESISPADVALLLKKSRINILWSRFEGINRAIIEGMFAGVPCILREGFNYGEHYFYINDQTGKYASDANLDKVILDMLSTISDYTPQDFVKANMTCNAAAAILSQNIAEVAERCNEPWTRNLDVKVNELYGMKYWDDNVSGFYLEEYKALNALLNINSK